MAKKMLIDATHAEETRVVVVDGNKVEEFDFESENKRQLAGNIYLAKVTRVEPSLQAAFVDYGGNRHGFLAFSEIHPDYYQIPVADREALLEEERAYAEAQQDREDDEDKPKRSRRSRGKSKAADARTGDAVETSEPIEGMETIDTSDDDGDGADEEGTSPMERVGETPVEEPDDPNGDPDDDASDDDTASDDSGDDDESDDDDNGDGDRDGGTTRNNGRRGRSRGGDASEKDDSIESVADDDDQEDIRPPRKPRPRRYKIQEVIKVRQILLVQVVKEERGNKGAALTTYLSLAGRYCVLMPNTARGGGISRKITNAADRKKLKAIATEIDVPKGAGLIVRTAGAKRTKAEIKRDYEYLQRLWEQIRELTLKSIAPAKIYEEGDLIKRSIRDLYNRDIDEVIVEGERGYRIAKDFMKMIMPSHAKNVKNYHDTMPLFARHQVESYLAAMFNPTVQLKSGGYIVIGVTEALVAIDVNSGRATKEGSIEETALKTNLEAAEEVARQLRLRDLAGLIVIDFIDMDERKNNAAVEKRMKDKLKTDRARIQVSRISGFGLMEMSRQRLRPGMIEATTQPCAACHGTGLIRSDDNLALSILRQIEEEGVRRRSREVLVKCPVSIANFLMNQKREHVAGIEARYGLSVRIEGDPTLISPDFSLEKFKTATRAVPEVAAPVVSVDSSIMDDLDDEALTETAAPMSDNLPRGEDDEGEDDDKPKKKRRRRRRRGGSKKSGNGEGQQADDSASDSDDGDDADTDATESSDAKPDTAKAKRGKDERADEADEVKAEAKTEPASKDGDEGDKPKPKTVRRSSSSRKKSDETGDKGGDAPTKPAKGDAKSDKPAEEGEKPKRTRAPRKKKETAEADAADKTDAAAKTEKVEAATPAPSSAPEPAPEPEKVSELAGASNSSQSDAAPAPDAPSEAESGSDDDKKPKRRGWWSLGR
ncbi:Rne/Rng family ribonuclease [Roseovarius sp. SCSIO 43702]|uniref:Rne/Rng family ribonuclease n=1 Tax=Roseovarius sp. SCSIO 43702 TaxID=2823043 RepID=UPI001C73CE31|nr:Rne/Rng family ribonuclease [Roseovarius sp. SCSIO 43702]QYX55576.1 Rne/Rng family ribonuclease [Roseovarius sp. SCSIO 43702]